MTRAVIIADDLTGANVTGALLRKNGYRFATFRHGAAVGPGVLSDYDAVAVSTDSRGIDPEAAYSKVKSTAQAFLLPAGCFYQKRIDSTLRKPTGCWTPSAAKLSPLSARLIRMSRSWWPGATF